MTEVARIVDQLHRAFYGEAWHGPAVLELLEPIAAAQAAARPLSQAHTIWEITHHISAWKDAGNRRLLGENVQPVGADDWPPVSATDDAAWADTLVLLRARHEALEKTIAAMGDAELEQLTPSKAGTKYFLIHGLIQHDLYHAGQIALLSKGR
jgi:uncharacterized damage-inducible protein DinB